MYIGLFVLCREECVIIFGMWSVVYFDRFYMIKYRYFDIVLFFF